MRNRGSKLKTENNGKIQHMPIITLEINEWNTPS